MVTKRPNQPDLVFNLVWTEGAFEYLGLFTMSLLAQTEARYRFVANGCQPSELASMERVAEAHPGRISDIAVVATDETLRHGDALDSVRAERDDGDHFCLIDPDILATGPFLDDFIGELAGHVALTSGRELWSDDNVLPEGHPGVSGEYFFRSDGYVFGSPHFAIYDAHRLRETTERWGVRFGEAGNGLADEARARLERAGHRYLVYDTGKLVNVFLQEDGGSVHHVEHDDLVHVGGLLHYLWAPRVGDGGDERVDWADWRGMTARHEVARYAAATVRALLTGRSAPAIPDASSNATRSKLVVVGDAVTGVVERYGQEWLATVGRAPSAERAASTSYDAMRRMGGGGEQG